MNKPTSCQSFQQLDFHFTHPLHSGNCLPVAGNSVFSLEHTLKAVQKLMKRDSQWILHTPVTVNREQNELFPCSVSLRYESFIASVNKMLALDSFC